MRFRLLGGLEVAAIAYQRALDLYRESADRYNEADVLLHLGDVQAATGNHDAARAAWQQAFTIFTEIRHPDAETARARLRPPRPELNASHRPH